MATDYADELQKLATMKKYLLYPLLVLSILCVSLGSAPDNAEARRKPSSTKTYKAKKSKSVHVKSYTRKNGTRVKAHYRSK